MTAATAIVVAATVFDWLVAWGVWSVVRRAVPGPVPARLDGVMPWLLVQVFLLIGVVVTGALATTNTGAVALTGIPIAVVSAFLAVPIVLFRARGPGRKIDWRPCLDHSYAAGAVWAVALALSVVL